MDDDCLRALYDLLIPDAKAIFDTLAVIEAGTMEKIMLEGKLKTQQARKGVWGLTSTGLIIYKLGRPICLSDHGKRLVSLLQEQQLTGDAQ